MLTEKIASLMTETEKWVRQSLNLHMPIYLFKTKHPQAKSLPVVANVGSKTKSSKGEILYHLFFE